ncbi:FtsX-like permease family protein [Lacipirellula limnantheis]|uniref:FtsX-like permease family protein n=1 Tax=Lacipirellula limnantheis TaxID=2528024 RepID=A0A517U351_9BACT|nr:FtsX-like permease family protein [Lacipirellula limnantheis]QDT75033.1 FtsX-like permease family protein [Lacipirellula limnantheis]
MNSWSYIAASLRQYWRIQASVAAGVAVTTAVITGALLVGDSMRGSLRDLALGSLGRIDQVLVAEHPFRQAGLLADDVRVEAAPLLLTQGSALYRGGDGEVRRAAQLQVLGVNDQFWKLAEPPMTPPIERGNQIALTADVAQELGVKVGDAVLLRLPLVESIPADSTLGEKEETAATRRLTVAAILDADVNASLARFALRPNQTAPRNAFVPLATMQSLLDLPDQANALAISGAAVSSDELRPTLADFGITVKDVSLGNGAPKYLQIAADRLVLPPDFVALAHQLYGKKGLQPVVTYLANRISAGDRRVPYSTVAGVDSTAALGPVVDDAGQPIALADNEVAINDWLASELNVKVGDDVTSLWYEPETTHGELREHPPLTLKVRAVLPLKDGESRSTAAADPDFAPELPGVTDQASIDDWELPFDLVETVRDEDEKYWDDYRTTPKAFVSHALAAKLWSTRWGTDSVLRIPTSEGITVESVTSELQKRLDPAQMGMSLLSVRQNALAAASGTTPFDGLFLGFSFFLMASAVMLTALLFRLGIEQRAREVGLLEALGMPLKKLRRLLLAEASIVAAMGALIGVLLGAGYARLMVYGLNTWWVAATAEPFLRLHITPRSLAIGFAVGVFVALATVAWSLRRFSKLPARQLLAGDVEPALPTKSVSRWSGKWLPAAAIVVAISLGAVGTRLEGEAQGGAFFGSGTLVLVGVLAAVRGVLRSPVVGRPNSLNLAGLAARNVRRNPSRTMLALGLAATASFLIVAMSAFRLAPTNRGVGGFDLLATADLPVLFDLGSESGRRELGFAAEDEAKLNDAVVVSFRVRNGQDASCLNLYKPTQPRILGAPSNLETSSDFAWAGEGDWSLLNKDLGNDANGQPIVPMALDRNTAFYALQLYAVGAQLVVRDGADRPVTLQIVGLLANSVLQGEVLISEANFLRLYPEAAGKRFFLLRRGKTSPPSKQLASLLETQLEDYGFDAVDARQRLAELLAVQNTYLSTFQSLGALGLLLGVVGLSVVQLRSIIERRGELALLQATGFRRRRLAWMVMAENLVLLVGGLAIGSLAALAAVLPHALAEQAGAPWATLAILLAIVATVGSLAGWLASRAVLRAPLLPALRGD